MVARRSRQCHAQRRPGPRQRRYHRLRCTLRLGTAARRARRGQSAGAAHATAEPVAVSATLRLRRPDDWHLHLRDGAALGAVLPFTAARFARAIVMPNLRPPVTTTVLALAYRARILQALPAGARFEPLLTLYLTDDTPADEITRAAASGCVYACKLYPAGATTHSDAGVTDLRRIDAVLERMAAVDLPLLVHGEVTDPAVDVFDREARFVDTVLAPLAARHARLRIVLEHVTTRAGVDFVRGARRGIAATITPQHLLLNRNALFAGGIRPHHYCLPVLKREADRRALLEAVAAGDARFFLGSDSAPHARHTKEHACGCAGIFSAHAGLELYAEAFEQAGMLPRLEAFASEFGPAFYRLPRNEQYLSLRREPWTVPAAYPYEGGELVPLRAGEPIAWRLDA
ncbi:MAG: dihydroorotase [Gammaproteobacteria bacterium]|nr:dihydroorotase [Gammaproteobacteria bacterium]